MTREYEIIQDIRLWYSLRHQNCTIRELLRNSCRELRELQQQRALQNFIDYVFS